jgi:hypothetical protein
MKNLNAMNWPVVTLLSAKMRGALAICFITLIGEIICSSCAYGQSCLEWKNVHISPRSHHAMAFDSDRQTMVVFGGNRANQYQLVVNETWERTSIDNRWILRSTTGPSPRGYTAMVYDGTRHVMVLFGGLSAQGSALGDTWEWNGQSWSLRATTGPAPQFGHAMSFDSKRGVTVLVGGNTTWEWNGNQWFLRTSLSPPIRDAVMTYDSNLHGCVLLGCPLDGGPMQVYSWDGIAWQIRATGGPSVRWGESFAFDESRNVCLMFGGWTNAPNFETWELNGSEWTLKSTGGPRITVYMTLAYDATLQRCIGFGGGPFDPVGDTLEWDSSGNQWMLRDGSPPLRATAMAYDSDHKVVMTYSTGYVDSQTGKWDGERWSILNSSVPPPRNGAVLVYDSLRHVMVLFGGANNTQLLGETWEWDSFGWTLRATTGPTPRNSFDMAFDSARGIIVLFGGTSDSTGAALADTWEWNGSVWIRRNAPTAPAPRYGHGMAYDSARGVTVLTGGERFIAGSGYITYQDTWEWNGASWSLRSQAGGGFGPLVFDPDHNVCLRLKRDVNGVNGDVRLWNGSSWSTWQTALRGDGYSLAYDSNRHRLVGFGGYPDRSTWELRIGIVGDLDCDDVVNVNDLLEVISAWGPCPPNQSCSADITGDGVVNVNDLLLVISNWD